jgi:hypothetical protein
MKVKCEISSTKNVGFFSEPRDFTDDELQHLVDTAKDCLILLDYLEEFPLGKVLEAYVIEDKLVCDLDFADDVDLDLFCGPCIEMLTTGMVSVGVFAEHVDKSVLSIRDSIDKYGKVET